MCCWLTGTIGRLKTQEVKCPVSEKQKTGRKKLGSLVGRCGQEQNDPMLLTVGQSMSARKKGPLGGAGLLDI